MNPTPPTQPTPLSGRTTLSVETTNEGHATAIATALEQLKCPQPTAVTRFEFQDPGGVIVHGWRIDAYFDTPPERESLDHALAAVAGSNRLDLHLAPTPDLNWVALSQAALPPIHAGRFHIHGSHDRDRTTTGQTTIEIDAGEAFGTAHHATTYLCLEAIGILTRKRSFSRALDLGCGSGVLAIAIARTAPRCAIIATDIDEKAIEVTITNARINRVGNRITPIPAAGLNHPLLNPRANFDLIVANILANPLIALAKDLSRVARPGSTLVLSGILTHQAREVAAAYRASGFTLNNHRRRDEWSALEMKKS